ncbi:hypothetical protein Tco_0987596 [Tanacetum coccineum]
MMGTKFDIEKIDRKNDFAVWQVRMKALLKQQGLAAALKELPTATTAAYGKSKSKRIDEFHKLVGDLAAIVTAIMDEDQALLLLTSLPSSYNNFVETLLYGWDTLKLEDMLATLNSKELQKMTKSKGDGGEGLYFEEHLKRDYPMYNHKKSQGFVRNKDQVFGFKADGYDNADVMIAMSVEELLDWIMDSGGSYHMTYMRDYLVDFEEYDGGNVMLGDGRECRTKLDIAGNSLKKGFYREDAVGQDQVTMKTLKGGKKLREYQTRWKIKTGIQQHNGLVKETNVTLLAKVRVQCRCCKELSLRWNHGRIMHLRNIGQGVGSYNVQTQEVIYYHLARDREQHSTHELFRYRKDNNEATFVVAAVEKIYAHESLAFNDTITCEVISKWKVGLKEDMVAQSVVYVLSNGCRKSSDDNHDYYWEYAPANNILGIEIVRDQSDNTLRVSQSRVHNEKLVQKGHSILSLEGGLSGDCDVEKNGKWSCIYAVESLQVYHGVYTRLDIASADVGMLDGFDHGLPTDALSRTETTYMTLTKAAKEAIWLKRLVIKSGFELKIVADIATGALSKDIPGLRFQHRLNLLSISIR